MEQLGPLGILSARETSYSARPFLFSLSLSLADRVDKQSALPHVRSSRLYKTRASKEGNFIPRDKITLLAGPGKEKVSKAIRVR